MPSKKKKYNARFPPARIKKIMQTDEEVGKVAAAVPVIISRALELFVESLVKKAGSVTTSRNAKTLTTSHIKQCVLADSNFQFLRTMVEGIPDVQGDEESSSTPTLEGQKPSSNSCHSNSSRGRKPKSRAGRASGAGPSHSTADESETCSAEDEDEEVSMDSGSETTSDHLVVSLPSSSSSSIPPTSCSTSFIQVPFQGYVPHPVQCNTMSSTDEDYDDL